MKTPENCESSLRNRKKKENVQEKVQQSVTNLSKSSEKMEDDPSNQVEQQREKSLKFKSESESKSEDDQGTVESFKSFRLKLEFDPMSIALFTLAIVTRFYKLSEPRNVV